MHIIVNFPPTILMGLKPHPLDLSSFSDLTLLVASFVPIKTCPRYDL